ncbi:fungal zn -cys binuclear cluster domain protein [Lentinula edodes]|uniref:Fungal zn-cys binuclear cluster domain protein n=1 Tax=Lentinula edodes TaxID=5353 RepID=A0A1Q3EGG3_LENED|nr:fungal zn -cys binuclear cluster domain protein [Lentinula edodes]
MLTNLRTSKLSSFFAVADAYSKSKQSTGKKRTKTHPAPRILAFLHVYPAPFLLCIQIFLTLHFGNGPILDGAEFSARFCAHAKGADSLGYEGSLLAMVLVVWAASFGLDERGIPSDESSGQCDSDSLRSNNRKGGMDMIPTVRSKPNEPDPSAVDEINVRRVRKERSEAMLREVLELVDIHAIMRRPTWDGVKVLMLILPLLEDEHPLDRLTMHEASLSQAHSLCTLLSGPPSSMPSISSGSSESPDEALMRARIFWYAHMQEGITTGMRGGRLVLSEDDLDVFQSTASRTAELGGGVDAEGMREVWEGLDSCWDEFEALRRGISTSAGGSMLGDVDIRTERFVSCWQIFIFECHNVIRESLKQYGSSPNTPANRSPARSPSPFVSPRQLHDIASRKCFRLLPCVLSIIKHHLTLTYESVDPTGLFKWDTGLCGQHFKQEPSERSSNSFGSGGGVDIVRPGLLPILDADEGTRICLAAIAEMQWAFSKSEEREEAIRIIWEDNKLKKQRQDQQHFNAMVGHHNIPSLPELELRYQPHHQQISSSYMIHGQQNGLSPLSLTSPTHSAPNSAPVTACTADGSGANGWPSYTPPGTSSSSNGTPLSTQGSPVFTTNITTIPNSYKNDDNFYHVVGVSDMDHFSFNAPATPVDPTSMMTAYQRNTTHVSGNNGVVHNGSGYLEYAGDHVVKFHASYLVES